jgi:hypothetical protein
MRLLRLILIEVVEVLVAGERWRVNIGEKVVVTRLVDRYWSR